MFIYLYDIQFHQILDPLVSVNCTIMLFGSRSACSKGSAPISSRFDRTDWMPSISGIGVGLCEWMNNMRLSTHTRLSNARLPSAHMYTEHVIVKHQGATRTQRSYISAVTSNRFVDTTRHIVHIEHDRIIYGDLWKWMFMIEMFVFDYVCRPFMRVVFFSLVRISHWSVVGLCKTASMRIGSIKNAHPQCCDVSLHSSERVIINRLSDDITSARPLHKNWLSVAHMFGVFFSVDQHARHLSRKLTGVANYSNKYAARIMNRSFRICYRIVSDITRAECCATLCVTLSKGWRSTKSTNHSTISCVICS